ncbi:MAG TPA: protein kinase [Candidatus Acidoferrales bacterium]|nr:protein kinase [Candidatus Acidoferrales bacterium]
MTDERWKLAYAIYDAAASLAEPERQQYVHASAPDAEIAGKVLAMLAESETLTNSDASGKPANSTDPTAAPPFSLPYGAALGRFVITGFVGQGGMGMVYSAHDPDLKRDVALKVIAPGAEATSSERFIREAQAASALNHPNIVTVYEVIHSGPTVAIAMELVNGTSLRRFCGTAQPVEKLAQWGRQIAHALAAAHARGIVHRDIKPENLMLRPDGYIKVLDFGLARQAGASRTDDHLPAGTLGYMSPEEVLLRPITAASDIFSLGIVLYELASGTNPFRGNSAGATLRLIQGLDAPPLPAQGKGVPRELDRLVREMLSKATEDRPAASEVALRLEAIAEPRVFRRRTVWMAAAFAMCALGGMAVWRLAPLHAVDDKPVLLRSVPLDSEPASETAPAFSPDGSSVVYASDLGSPGIHHIATRSLSGLASGGAGSNQALTLTSAPQDDTNPVWSPDGSRIAFLRRTSTEALQVIVVPAGGGPERLIATLSGHRPGARKYVTWAPDGEALVAADRLKDGFALRLYRLPVSGGTERPVTDGPDAAQDVSPAFSPDGRWLAYLRWVNGATYELWVVPQPGGKPKLLVTSPAPIATFAWKPDSRTIVYGGGAISTGELRQVTTEGRRAPAPFALEGESDQIVIAPTGARLAYVLQNLDANIWRVPLARDRRKDSTPPEKLFTSVREEMDPAFSPDGKSIAFVSNRSGRWNLWIGNTDGTGLRELAAQSLLPFHPAWSPDSREIAFDSAAFGKGEIWLISASGGLPSRLIAMPGGAEVPSWSPDGRRVVFYTNAEGSRQIWEVAATGGAPVQLTHGGSYDPSESADGRYLYYGSVSSPGVWRMPLEPRLTDGSLANRHEELIRETLPVTGHRFWTLGQGGIYFVDAQKTPAVLKFVDLASRKVTVLATLPKPPAKFTRGLSVSPDGRYALYCEDDVDRYEIRVVKKFP